VRQDTFQTWHNPKVINGFEKNGTNRWSRLATNLEDPKTNCVTLGTLKTLYTTRGTKSTMATASRVVSIPKLLNKLPLFVILCEKNMIYRIS